MAVSINLSGKVALITGSSRGLGLTYAHELANVGADVIIHDETPEKAAQFGEAESGPAVAEQIRALGRKSTFIAADLADAAQAEALVKQVLDEFGRIDLLVNNAGGDIGATTPRPNPNDALDISADDIRSVVERNLLSTMYMCKYVGAHMRDRKAGKIINVGSVAGHLATQNGIIYAAAKAGISHYTKCLAAQMKQYNVNVNCLAPKPVITGRFLATRAMPNQEGMTRLQQVAVPKDMATIILFLCSELSDQLTGDTIVC